MSLNFLGNSESTGQQSQGGFTVKTIAGVVAFVAVAGLSWYAGSNGLLMNEKGSGLVLGASTDYQSVFLTNGQVYFGKLSEEGSWIVLRDIYYLQVSKQLQPSPEAPTTDGTTPPATTTQPNIQLVKLGSELHGPQDEMFLEKDKVLFWENMKDDSKVVQAIHKYQETKK